MNSDPFRILKNYYPFIYIKLVPTILITTFRVIALKVINNL
jgi:hypothetical protein